MKVRAVDSTSRSQKDSVEANIGRSSAKVSLAWQIRIPQLFVWASHQNFAIALRPNCWSVIKSDLARQQ